MEQVNGNTWARHRRYTQIPFNEKSSAVVWDRSLRQVETLIKSWASKNPRPEKSTTPEWMDGIHRLVFGVFNAAGFGIDLSFQGEDARTNDVNSDDYDAVFSDHARTPGITRTFRQCNLDFDHYLYAVMGSFSFPDWFSKRFMGKAYQIREEMRWYIQKVIDNAKVKMEKGDNEEGLGDSLIALLLKSGKLAEEEEKAGEKKEGEKSRLAPLTQEEIFGNTWMFSLAGTETTIRVVQLAIGLLAAHQEVQEWLREDIENALEGESDDPRKWGYEVFGKLKGSCCVLVSTSLIRPSVYANLDRMKLSATLPPLPTISELPLPFPPPLHCTVKTTSSHPTPTSLSTSAPSALTPITGGLM